MQRKKGDELTELRRRLVMDELEFQQKLRQVQERLLMKMEENEECVELQNEFPRHELRACDGPQELGEGQSIDD